MTKIEFQPMPKRFMVWSTEFQKFITYQDLVGSQCQNLLEEIMSVETLRDVFEQFNSEYLIICQSTNLFDKDGKEIFEGSIVEANWGFNTGSTYLDCNTVGIVKNLNGVWCITEDNSDTDGKMLCELEPDDLNLLGHTLSNPELLEEGNV